MSVSDAGDELDGMEPQHAVCTDTELTVALRDGRRITAAAWWYPRLLNATPEQRSSCEPSCRPPAPAVPASGPRPYPAACLNRQAGAS